MGVLAFIRDANAKYGTLNFEGVIADYTQAIKHDWENSQLYYSRGKASYNLKNYDDAAKDFYKAAQLDNSNQAYKENLKIVGSLAKNGSRLAFSDYKN